MVNTPLYGLDNWIYLAHEGAAGAVIYTDRFGDLDGLSPCLRFPTAIRSIPAATACASNPDAVEMETLSGQSQYGHAFDEWGRYFGSNNSNHIRLEVLAARYLARNHDLPSSVAMDDISDHGTAAKVFSITERPTYELLTEAGEFTSACSVTPYTGGAFPGEYAHSTFVAEPVHNLVHRDVLAPSGASLRARRGSEGARIPRLDRCVVPSGRLLRRARRRVSMSSITTGSGSNIRSGPPASSTRTPPSSRWGATAGGSTASSPPTPRRPNRSRISSHASDEAPGQRSCQPESLVAAHRAAAARRADGRWARFPRSRR